MNDTYKLYLKDIEKFEVLSGEEEQEIGNILRSPEFSVAEKEAARNKLVNHNLKYVIKIAMDYKSKAGCQGVDIMDLISAGNMGLLTAVEKYKWEVGKFTTYATAWIFHAMQKVRNDLTSSIAKSDHLVQAVIQVAKIQNVLEQLLYRKPSTVEIVEALDGTLTDKRVDELLLQNQNNVVSIDSKTVEVSEDDLDYSEVIPSDTLTPEEVVMQADRDQILKVVLSKLPYLNRRVLELSFGLGSGDEKTYGEISEILFREGYGYQGKPYTKQNISLIKIKGIELIQGNENLMQALQACMEK